MSRSKDEWATEIVNFILKLYLHVGSRKRILSYRVFFIRLKRKYS